MHIRPRVPAAVVLSCLMGASLAVPASAAEPAPENEQRKVSVEYFTGPGAKGRHTEVPATAPARRSLLRSATPAPDEASVSALAENGPVGARLDLVVMGDGYTATEQGDFEADAQAKVKAIFQIEPYKSYRELFNVWIVNAVSNESGVTGDTSRDSVKDTALSSYFWCAETERLLCVDTDKVSTYAAQAPAADIVFVLANTTKYGGAGYSGVENSVGYDGIATMSSDNAQSALIGAHELGHSIGHLADEYTYPSLGTYTYDEPVEANASVHDAAQQNTQRTKWWRWLGEADPAGGTVGTYEGSYYYPLGIYRPTENSLMRALNTDTFNLVGREAMIGGFYRYAKTLTSTLPTDREIGLSTPIRVDLTRLGASDIADVELRWYVDGVEVRQARGIETVDARRLGVHKLRGSTHTVTARAVDTTDAIRDPAVREATETSLSWTVRGHRH
ncbi:M64 family metallopeptidase [Streptomyces sp. NPDC059534]|uniref:M64 family metallopeptidase n=1 Tax=Streptomyces sp. NPDC059534 TaxID=3346859 RepID=UPI0036A57C2F